MKVHRANITRLSAIGWWPEILVEIAYAMCYVRSAIVHEFFDNPNRSTPIKGFDRRGIKLRA
jgi:hypothetical protein